MTDGNYTSKLSEKTKIKLKKQELSLLINLTMDASAVRFPSRYEGTTYFADFLDRENPIHLLFEYRDHIFNGEFPTAECLWKIGEFIDRYLNSTGHITLDEAFNLKIGKGGTKRFFYSS